MYVLIENFEGKTIQETLDIYAKIKGPFGTTGIGLVGNSNFTYTGTSGPDCVADGLAFSDAHDLAAGGDHLKVLAAEGKMVIFHGSLSGIAKQSNLQHTGNELELETTGIPLALEGNGVGTMAKAVITSVEGVDGVTGRAVYTIVKSKKFCHGTYIQVQDILPLGAFGPIREYHTQLKHIFELDVFTRGVDTQTRVCYDGTDKVRVYSDWKPFMGQ